MFFTLLTFPSDSCAVLDHFLRTTKPDARVVRRAVAVRAVAAGWLRIEVSEAQGIDVASLRRWVGRFVHEGVAGLLDHPRSGRPYALTPEQEAVLMRLVGQAPEQCGVQRRRWTCATLNAEFFRQTGVQITNETVRRILVNYPATKHSPDRQTS